LHLLLGFTILAFLVNHNLFAQNPIDEKNDWYFITEDEAAQIYVYEVGKGETFVVLHGGFGAQYGYLLNAVKGVETKYRFVFYDQRGSLLSPTKTENVSVQKHVQDLETLRKALGLEKINLLAHSMGTLLAMHYVREFPERAGKIVMIGAVYPKAGENLSPAEKNLQSASQKAFADFRKRPAVVAEFEKFGMKGLEKDRPERTKEDLESIGENWSKLTVKQQAQLDKISFAAVNIYHVERWNQMKFVKPFFNDVSGNAAYKSLEKDYNFVPALQKHPFPITVINGDHDFLDVGGKLWQNLSSELKNAELIFVKNAGHNIWIDQPDIFREILGRALSKKLQ
jgi:proline iminopeptidase